MAKLLEVRQQSGLSQREIARRLGWHNASYLRFERGERSLEIIEFLDICKALGCDGPGLLAELNRALSDGAGDPDTNRES